MPIALFADVRNETATIDSDCCRRSQAPPELKAHLHFTEFCFYPGPT